MAEAQSGPAIRSGNSEYRRNHIFVGAGDGPCVILMAGARTEDEQVHYPISALAGHYGASADEETRDPKQAYARFGLGQWERPAVWDRLPWALAGRP